MTSLMNDQMDIQNFVVASAAIYRHEDMLVDAIQQVTTVKAKTDLVSKGNISDIQAIDKKGYFKITLNTHAKPLTGVVSIFQHRTGRLLDVVPADNDHLGCMDLSFFRAAALANGRVILTAIDAAISMDANMALKA